MCYSTFILSEIVVAILYILHTVHLCLVLPSQVVVCLLCAGVSEGSSPPNLSRSTYTLFVSRLWYHSIINLLHCMRPPQLIYYVSSSQLVLILVRCKHLEFRSGKNSCFLKSKCIWSNFCYVCPGTEYYHCLITDCTAASRLWCAMVCDGPLPSMVYTEGTS